MLTNMWNVVVGPSKGLPSPWLWNIREPLFAALLQTYWLSSCIVSHQDPQPELSGGGTSEEQGGGRAGGGGGVQIMLINHNLITTHSQPRPQLCSVLSPRCECGAPKPNKCCVLFWIWLINHSDWSAKNPPSPLLKCSPPRAWSTSAAS